MSSGKRKTTQLSLDIVNLNPPKKYRLHLNLRFVLESDDEDEIWDRIGQAPFGTGHIVYGPDGYCVEEFVPF